MRAVHHSSNVKTFNELKMSTHSNLITMICKKILLANENLTFRFSSALRFCILTGILLLLLFASNSSQDVDLFGQTLGPLVPSRVFLVPLDLSCLSHEATLTYGLRAINLAACCHLQSHQMSHQKSNSYF